MLATLEAPVETSESPAISELTNETPADHDRWQQFVELWLNFAYEEQD